MGWIGTAFIAAAIQGVVSIFDSHLLSRRMIGMKAFMLVMGMVGIFYGFILYLIFPWPGDMPLLVILAVIGASIGGATAVLITLFVLQKEEVSKVIPITHTSPVFVAIIAALLLDEKLDILQWLAIVIVVAGAMMIAVEKSGAENTGKLKKPIFLLFIASLMAAMGNVFSKYALDYISHWNMYSMAIIIVGTINLVIAFRPSIFRQWKTMPRRNSSLVILVFNEFLALSASVIYLRAVSMGPVSLVVTIMSSRPVLVLVYSIILSIILPGFLMEPPGRRIMVLRFIAIAMIVGGLSIISLT